MATPLDPVFLLLPILEAAAAQVRLPDLLHLASAFDNHKSAEALQAPVRNCIDSSQPLQPALVLACSASCIFASRPNADITAGYLEIDWCPSLLLSRIGPMLLDERRRAARQRADIVGSIAHHSFCCIAPCASAAGHVPGAGGGARRGGAAGPSPPGASSAGGGRVVRMRYEDGWRRDVCTAQRGKGAPAEICIDRLIPVTLSFG